MKLLLTSAGISNTSIHNALVDLLGKPIAQSSALCIPTATYAMGGPASAWRVITGRASTPLCELGWKSLGVLELTALPSIDQEHWLPTVWIDPACPETPSREEKMESWHDGQQTISRSCTSARCAWSPR